MSFRKIIIGLIFFVLTLFVVQSTASAKVISEKRGTVLIDQDEVVDDDLFVAGELVEINGIVNGDVFVGAETVKIRGVINGDLHAAGALVEVTGTITDDAYIGAGTVRIYNSTIGGSLVIGAGEVALGSETYIGGSLISGSGLIDTSAHIGRNALIGAGDIIFNSKVGGEARLGAGTLNVGSGTVIRGDLYYILDEDSGDLALADEASVSGDTVRLSSTSEGLRRVGSHAEKGMKIFKFGFDIFSFFGALVVGLIGIKLFPIIFKGVATNVSTKSAKSLAYGLLVLIAFIPAVVGLMITLIGLPLAIIIFFLVIVEMYFAKLFVGLAVGQWLLPKFGVKKTTLSASFTLGLFAVYLLKALPIVGFIFSVFVLLLGLGAQVVYKKDKLFARK